MTGAPEEIYLDYAVAAERFKWERFIGSPP